MIDNNVKIIGYSGDRSLIIIPSKLSGYDVTTIASNAIRVINYSKVVIPESVQTIDQNAITVTSYYNYVYVYSYADSKPTNWNSSFISGNYTYKYWNGQWSFVDGVPVTN